MLIDMYVSQGWWWWAIGGGKGRGSDDMLSSPRAEGESTWMYWVLMLGEGRCWVDVLSYVLWLTAI